MVWINDFEELKVCCTFIISMIASDEIENKEIAKQYKELLQISYQTLSDNDKKLIRSAFDTAVHAHRNQRRKTGEPYIFHPINVAKIVAHQIGLDATSIASACLKSSGFIPYLEGSNW